MSRIFSEFDILDYPLDRGKVLIEAAAGSGKTYTIQYLFLRLILERDDLEVSNILVVTFTEAATEELKERIRGILREAANLLAKVSKSRPLDVEKDGDLGRVLAQALGKGRSISRLRDRLQLARTAFDEVVIATIHGFCSRMLSDYAFECGSRVGLELVKESRFFIQSVAEDYWRRTFYRGSESLVETVVAQGLSLESLIELGLQLDRGPDLVVLPEKPESGSWAADMAHFVAEIDAVGRSFRSSCAVARNYLENELEEIEEILFAGSLLKGGSWSKSKFPQYISNLQAVLATTAWPDDDGFKALTKFSRDDLIKKTKIKNKKNTPEHPLFHLCGELVADVVRQREFSGRLLCALKRDFLDFMAGPSGLKLCKEKSRKQGYSDYLTGLSQVLKGPSGGRLQELVAERFKVALVDEFQDTDPLQNSIFNTFFDRPEVLFYRIGDPKQSIYSFRGADIYAYLEAASGEGQKLATLDKNYRSTPRLLDAFNRIFSIPSPFLLDGIDYRKMICGQPPKEQKRLLIDGSEGAALHFWHFTDTDGGDLNKGNANRHLFAAVADSCAEILDLARQPFVNESSKSCWRAEIAAAAASPGQESSRPVRASDIAILTATNAEAAQMWQACQNRNLPAVVAAAGNLWQTPEAREVFLFLQAQLTPDNDTLLSSSMATSLLGFEARFLAAVHDLSEEESKERKEYEIWRQAFFLGRDLWTKHGVMATFAGFPDFSKAAFNPAADFDLRLNLARTLRGERALTNFYHLQEVLHQAESEYLLGPKALLNWMQEHLTGVAKDTEEYELRLESEAHALQIMTMHKSKGLEFPIVFAPFLWSRSFIPSGGKKPLTIFHKKLSLKSNGVAVSKAGSDPDKAVSFGRYLDLSPKISKEHTQAARSELLAESIRLVYVALTRAKMRLYLAWPKTKNSGKTALMYLRKPPQNENEKNDFIAQGGPSPGLAALDDENAVIWEDSLEIIRELPFSKRMELDPDVSALVSVKAREFKRKLPARGGILSFSSLTATDHSLKPARIKSAKKGLKPDKISTGIPPFAGFPGGTATGNAIHQIFEELDFKRVAQVGWQDDPKLSELVQSSLAQFDLITSNSGVDVDNLTAAVLAMLDKVLNTPLPGYRGEIKLSQSDLFLRREMEFCLPVPAALAAGRVAGVLSPEGSAAFNRLDFNQLSNWQLSFPEQLPEHGYLNGFIDLVFSVDGCYYLLDWKTNNLGPDYADYNYQALQQSMLDSKYLLQYNLYLVALDRFLASRLKDYDYETNFGGVYYLYVRGINGSDATTGVFYDRPEYAQVSALKETICGKN